MPLSVLQSELIGFASGVAAHLVTGWLVPALLAHWGSAAPSNSDPYTRTDLHVRTTRLLPAALLVFGWVHSFYLDRDGARLLWSDPVSGTSAWGQFYLCWCVGYYIFETALLATIYYRLKRLDVQLLAHHIFCVVCFHVSAVTQLGQFFGIITLVDEIIVPMSTWSFWLQAVGKSQQYHWLIPQCLAILFLLTVRLPIDAVVVYHLATHFSSIVATFPIYLLGLLLLGTPVLIYLNLFWTYRYLRRLRSGYAAIRARNHHHHHHHHRQQASSSLESSKKTR